MQSSLCIKLTNSDEVKPVTQQMLFSLLDMYANAPVFRGVVLEQIHKGTSLDSAGIWMKGRRYFIPKALLPYLAQQIHNVGLSRVWFTDFFLHGGKQSSMHMHLMLCNGVFCERLTTMQVGCQHLDYPHMGWTECIFFLNKIVKEDMQTDTKLTISINIS